MAPLHVRVRFVRVSACTGGGHSLAACYSSFRAMGMTAGTRKPFPAPRDGTFARSCPGLRVRVSACTGGNHRLLATGLCYSCPWCEPGGPFGGGLLDAFAIAEPLPSTR